MIRPLLLALAAVLSLSAAIGHAKPVLTAKDSRFVLTLDGGKVLTSENLVGAVLDVLDDTGTLQHIRIDAVMPHPDHPQILLHDFRIQTADGTWAPLCDADAKGRRLGLPVAGYWNAEGRFVADPTKLFTTCTSGSQAKCIFFGYDPWTKGPKGEDLVPFYEACQHMVRAAYGGTEAHTTNGTTIDLYDDLGIQTPATDDDTSFDFEAGWTPSGAVCVRHPRHPEVITAEGLKAAYPTLPIGDTCTEAFARAKGAHLFNRSRPKPTDGF
jgi:hypothetical protein